MFLYEYTSMFKGGNLDRLASVGNNANSCLRPFCKSHRFYIQGQNENLEDVLENLVTKIQCNHWNSDQGLFSWL